jgi:hypothetical protein
MGTQSVRGLAGRQQKRLQRAQDRGYLNAACAANEMLVRAYGLWCWRLKLPMVWVERRTRWSRYGRVRLDMFTTLNMLTARGQSELKTLAETWKLRGDSTVTPHDGCWERVPLARANEFTKAVFTIALRAGNSEPNRSKLRNIDSRGPAKPFKLESLRAVPA